MNRNEILTNIATAIGLTDFDTASRNSILEAISVGYGVNVTKKTMNDFLHGIDSILHLQNMPRVSRNAHMMSIANNLGATDGYVYDMAGVSYVSLSNPIPIYGDGRVEVRYSGSFTDSFLLSGDDGSGGLTFYITANTAGQANPFGTNDGISYTIDGEDYNRFDDISQYMWTGVHTIAAYPEQDGTYINFISSSNQQGQISNALIHSVKVYGDNGELTNHYKFDEGSGDTVLDSVGGEMYSGTIQNYNASQWVEERPLVSGHSRNYYLNKWLENAVSIVEEWILAGGSWDDTGLWDDTETWNDGA